MKIINNLLNSMLDKILPAVPTLPKPTTVEANGYTWQPIATAPKDGYEILLGWQDGVHSYWTVATGFWNVDSEAKRPRPFWQANHRSIGVIEIRKCQPTHWQPLPAPPVKP